MNIAPLTDPHPPRYGVFIAGRGKTKQKTILKHSEAQWQFLNFAKIFSIQGTRHPFFPTEEPLG